MKKILVWLIYVKKSFYRIELIDRCLIVFMAVLMIQSAYNLFSNETISDEIHAIDIVIRTTAAGIFGYFLSANFIKREVRGNRSSSSDPPILLTSLDSRTSQSPPAPTNQKQIGFSTPLAGSDMLDTEAIGILSPCDIDKKENPNDQQVIIAAVIGLSALCILLIARNFIELTPATIGTLSQMRDFVSGCVGFLLGSPGKEQT